MKKTLAQHLDPNSGPKKILSLDGGGIRGALTLGYLKKIETILRKKENDPALVLSDHFDLIGGTSTGAIIAASLSIGMEVDEVVKNYMDLGGKIFGKKRDWWKPWLTMQYLKAGYDFTAMESSLKDIFKNITLGGSEIKTGLCIVSKRADTNSVWPVINHPKGKYYDSEFGKNKNIPLWQAVRASSAAPTYFVPQMIDVGNNNRAAFVDGGVSMANNPALILLQVATMKGYPFHWEIGEDKLTIVSLGTGYSIFHKRTDEIEEAWLGTWAQSVPEMLMQDASWQNQAILQWLSNSPTAAIIDGEMGKMEGDHIAGKPLLSYLRYNFPITLNDLNGLELGKAFNDKDVASIIEMSNADNRELLYQIGTADAAKIIDEAHFQ